MTKPGPLQIRNAAAVEKIRELAQLRGKGLTETAGAAVREALQREREGHATSPADILSALPAPPAA